MIAFIYRYLPVPAVTGLEVTCSIVSLVYIQPGPEVIKLFSCSTQLSLKFILPIKKNL